jgi:hypothetical protein
MDIISFNHLISAYEPANDQRKTNNQQIIDNKYLCVHFILATDNAVVQTAGK